MSDIETYQPRVALTIADATELVQRVDEAKRLVMRDGTDYGRVPGTDRPTLLKPGAERLLQLFALGHRMRIVETERDAEGHPWAVTVECAITKGDVTVGSCLGYASYDEERYAQTAAQRQAKEDANATRYHRQPRQVTEGYRAPFNTLLKMAQKRALVGAALQVTGSSGTFTQDVEDDEGTLALDTIRAICRELVKAQPPEVRERLAAELPPSPDWGVREWAVALVALGSIKTLHEMNGD
jgi:hypothetical protein